MTLKKPSANGRNITVVLFGEILVDVFPDRTVLGGAPFNVARHLQGFGLHPVLISRIGCDTLQQRFLSSMKKFGMNIQGIQTDLTHPTGQVLVRMEKGGHSFEILPDQAYDYIDSDTARRTILEHQPELIYFGSLAQRHCVSRNALESLFKNAQAPRFLDINLRAPWFETQTLRNSLSHADFLKLNIEELRHLGNLFHLNTTGDENLATALVRNFGLKSIIVTCGDTGAWLRDEQGNLYTADSSGKIQVVDTVGAGDGFSAIVILGLFSNWPLGKTLLRADAFARKICEIRGAVPPDDSFYRTFRDSWYHTDGESQ